MIVIHETNGRKYLEALVDLQRRGKVRSLRFVEASVVWKFAHGIVRERRSFGAAFRQAMRNLAFRLTALRERGAIVVICLPPWDFRFLYYALLRRRNRIVYNTSWPFWSVGRVPRSGGAFAGVLKRAWLRVLRRNDVDVVAVTGAAADAVRGVLPGKAATTIPHVVSEAFFERHASYGRPFRLVFVGELVENRGLRVLSEAIDALANEPIALDIVGDGPLRAFAQELAARTGGTWHRHLGDRAALAAVVASAQVLVSPSIRTARWEELFGMAILEAMACGVPCIVSDHIGPRSLIETGVSGVLVPERSPLAIADVVRRFMNDRPAWEAMSAAARARAERSRLSAVAEQWDALFLRRAH